MNEGRFWIIDMHSVAFGTCQDDYLLSIVSVEELRLE
jgi:hypothetical protein